MEILYIVMFVVFFIIAIGLSYQSFKYFNTMWKYKNRKKDGSEDKYFKKFD